MKPSKDDINVITLGESEVWDETKREYTYTFETEWQIIEQTTNVINYDSDAGCADREHIYILRHPESPDFYKLRYVYSSWGDYEHDEPVKVSKRAVTRLEWVEDDA